MDDPGLANNIQSEKGDAQETLSVGMDGLSGPATVKSQQTSTYYLVKANRGSRKEVTHIIPNARSQVFWLARK